MKYRDLTGKDVVQTGDQCSLIGKNLWTIVPDEVIGFEVSKFTMYKIRRVMPPSEITASERKRFESWLLGHCSKEYRATYLKESIEPKYEDGDYQDEDVQVSWKTWCAAVNCDPMADLKQGMINES